MRFFALIFGALAANSAVGLAQSAERVSWPPAIGVRARILSPVLGKEKQEGVIESITGDTLRFKRAEAMTSQALAPGQITMIEVPTGEHTATGKGTLIGALLGGAVGAAIGAATYKPRKCGDELTCNIDAGFQDERRLASVLLGGLAGMVSGGIAGAWWGHRVRETWTPVAVPAQ